ncbi:MAG: hypothetical protein QOE90_2348 [Thermoplasmata archaeon]|jgi:hypothetical protein|nr:hypothetical protein [Thermoplasmata archaeon]
MLGYYHQARYALYLALRAEDPTATIEIETADDIVFDAAGEPRQLLQSKHHASKGSIANASVELWKTLRIWAEHERKTKGAADVRYVLVTTAKASGGSAAQYLRPGPARSVEKAWGLLSEVPDISTREENETAYTEWKKLRPKGQKRLLEKVHILDGSPNILQTDQLLRDRLGLLAAREKVEDFMAAVEGQWLRGVIRRLAGQMKAPLIVGEIQDYAHEVSLQYRRDALTIDFDKAVPAGVVEDHDDRQFVDQLRWINATPDSIRRSIQDYYRAFQQRSLWVRKQRIHPDEIEEYDNQLIDEWSRRVDVDQRGLGNNPNEAACVTAGWQTFQWAHSEAAIHIRDDCTVPYVCRGSFHVLADADPPDVGWHPHYLAKAQARKKGGKP